MITVCEKYKVKPEIPKLDSVVGLAIESLGKGVIHGLRHPVKGNLNGWYIWCGVLKSQMTFSLLFV